MANHTGIIELVVRPGNMQVLGRIDPTAAPGSATEESLLRMLSARSIEPTEDVTRRISELVTRLQKGRPPRADVLLAEGVPPVPGTDGHIVWAEDYGPDGVRAAQDDDEINYYAQSDIMSISAGDLVCTIVPPTRGRPGRDIYGREVPPHKGRRCPMVFGESIAHDPDNPPGMIALKSGRLNIVGQHAWISPLLIINRNVDFISGSINFDGDVMIRGNVLDLFSVKATGNIVVRGLIEGAQVEAGGNLVAAGGIAGKEKAVIRVGGKLKARFLDNATVSGAAEVYVQKEILNSKVSISGRLTTPGTISGCTIEACRGIEAGVVGSRSGVLTSLIVGYDRETQKQLARLETKIGKLQQAIAVDRTRLEPLLKRKSNLSKMLKNRLVKILTRVKEKMAKADELEREKLSLQELLRDNREASIAVSRIVREGTIIQIGKASLTLSDTLRGPLKLVTHRIGGRDRIAAMSRNKGRVVLEACTV